MGLELSCALWQFSDGCFELVALVLIIVGIACIAKDKYIGGFEMKHIETIGTRNLCESAANGGCGECQTSCQSACKTSCGIANQQCEKTEKESK